MPKYCEGQSTAVPVYLTSVFSATQGSFYDQDQAGFYILNWTSVVDLNLLTRHFPQLQLGCGWKYTPRFREFLRESVIERIFKITEVMTKNQSGCFILKHNVERASGQ